MGDPIPYYKHFVAEIECKFEFGDSIDWLEKKSEEFLNKLEISVVNKMYHKFEPQGISLLYILASSHMAVHSWPENNYLHIDLITCSQKDSRETVDAALKSTFVDFKYALQELSYNKHSKSE